MSPDELLSEFPKLVTVDGSKLSKPALGAKNIRTILRKYWPNVKFSITSESFSMGSAINIRWEEPLDNPPAKQDVERYCAVFCYSKPSAGYDDGMDIHSERWEFTKRYGGAKFVNVEERRLTAQERAAMRGELLEQNLTGGQPRNAPRL